MAVPPDGSRNPPAVWGLPADTGLKHAACPNRSLPDCFSAPGRRRRGATTPLKERTMKTWIVLSSLALAAPALAAPQPPPPAPDQDVQPQGAPPDSQPPPPPSAAPPIAQPIEPPQMAADAPPPPPAVSGEWVYT